MSEPTDKDTPDPTETKAPPVKRLNQRALMAVALLAGVALWALVAALVQKPATTPAGELPVRAQDPKITQDLLAQFLAEANRKQREIELGMAQMQMPPGAPSAQTTAPFPPAPEGWQFEPQEDPAREAALAPDDPYAQPAPAAARPNSAESQLARALASPLAPSSFSSPASRSSSPDRPGSFDPPAIALPQVPELSSATPRAVPSPAESRQAWLAAQDGARTELRRPQLEPPSGALGLRAGTLIPAVLLSGLSSDLPGLAIATVRRPVYDSDRGDSVLIPQGARLLGRYDSRVVYGQRRLLLAWTRLVLPDGSALDLPAAAATDAIGRAGLGDRVDNHFARLFGSALLLSAVSAAAQLSQPDQGLGATGLTASEIAAAAVGQEMARVTSAVVARELEVAPTLEIRPGFLFNVEVAADLLWPRPWSTHPLLVPVAR